MSNFLIVLFGGLAIASAQQEHAAPTSPAKATVQQIVVENASAVLHDKIPDVISSAPSHEDASLSDFASIHDALEKEEIKAVGHDTIKAMAEMHAKGVAEAKSEEVDEDEDEEVDEDEDEEEEAEDEDEEEDDADDEEEHDDEDEEEKDEDFKPWLEDHNAVLQEYDTDKDGKLSVSELSGDGANENQMRWIEDEFKKADSDADGFMDVSEFSSYLAVLEHTEADAGEEQEHAEDATADVAKDVTDIKEAKGKPDEI